MTAPTTAVDDRLDAAVRSAHPVVWLDDDPTGTQAVHDLPVLTAWDAEDVAWALSHGGPGFFVLTNTRSLDPAGAAARVREVVGSCLDAAAAIGTTLVFASRGDSTLRSNFPAETDAIREVLDRRGLAVDGLLLAPAFPSAGRLTIDGVHHVRTPDGLLPAAETEYARDATFGYRSSDLGAWAAEKAGRPLDVVRLPVRTEATAEDDLDVPFDRGHDDRVVVVDARDDADLRAAVLPLLRAEAAGARFVYQVGPAFVGARSGQRGAPLVSDEHLDEVVDRSRPGLVVVGSHVARTTRQLQELHRTREVRQVELDATLVLEHPDAHVAEVVERTADALASGPTALTTSRTLVRGTDGAASLDIARRVSDALARTVREVVARQRPSYVVAKGGITSSQVATDALGVRRAWVVGTMLPGLVSLWRVEDGPAAGLPYVVFAGNVGDDDALARVVDRLEPTP